MSDDERLKPCPFCGGEAHLDNEYDYDAFVSCSFCGAKGKTFILDVLLDEEDIRTLAVHAWNRRVQS